MNCANHADKSAVAYCRTCGKPLCANCTRDVRGVIYCENCLAARLEGTQPSAMPVGPAYPPQPPSGPIPVVAGILAGVFPFGVGAVYTSQYAKGLAQLLIFVGLIWGADHASGNWGTLFGLAIAFFYVYQIVDAVRSARAIQLGQPAPDPFGLGQALGAGERLSSAKIPTGAIVLIGLGILFLLQTMGVLEFDFDRIWPVFLIALGLWLFARHWGLLGASPARCYCEQCRSRRMMGPAVLVTIGALSLLENTTRFGWGRTWPILILVIGLVLLLKNQASGSGHILPPTLRGGSGAAPGGTAADSTQQASQPPANEVRNV